MFLAHGKIAFICPTAVFPNNTETLPPSTDLLNLKRGRHANSCTESGRGQGLNATIRAVLAVVAVVAPRHLPFPWCDNPYRSLCLRRLPTEDNGGPLGLITSGTETC